ncbi:VOC family protein [Salinibacterium sedimenticola]|uniref:VOC family protein n=1 Tax=Homoserinimonas sedimenticola TaxID=2986805 RepID=UPI002235DD04|nr:VOC family protein [Salinibacterium sedimenticola]
MTPDAAASLDFYASVLDWTFESPVEAEIAALSIAKAGSSPVASIQQGVDGLNFDAVWNPYFAVDDLAETVARAKANRAVILAEPFTVPGAEESIGTFAFVMDPSGAGFCLWQAPEGAAPVARAEPGYITWTVLYAEDTANFAFYADTLGWIVGEPSPVDDYRLARLGDGSRVAAIRRLPEGSLPGWRTYFCVANLNAAVDATVAYGGTVLEAPTRIEDGRPFAVVADPLGATFGIVQAE